MILQHLMNHEKHYITLNNYLRAYYGEKVYKISLNPGFTCPNRDGKVDTTGCLFCSSMKSGDFSGDVSLSLKAQFASVKERMQAKWEEGSYIAYLQAGTNTYAPLDVLEKTFSTLLNLDEKVKSISIATRPDEIYPEIIELLKNSKPKDGLGGTRFSDCPSRNLPFLSPRLRKRMFRKAVKLLHEANIAIIVHIINGLPFETKEMMLETVQYLAEFPISESRFICCMS